MNLFRDAAKSIARNTSVMFFQHIITTASSVVLLVFVPRYLGPVEYGRLYLAASITGMFQIFVNFGNNYLIAKNVARDSNGTGQTLVDAWGLRALLAFLSLGLMAGFGMLAGYPREVQVMLIINGLGLFVWGAYTSLYACYQGREALRHTSVGAVVEKVSVCVVAIAFLMMGAGAIQVAVIIVVGNLLNVVVLMVRSGSIVSAFPRISWEGAREQLKDGLPYFLFGIFGVIYYKIDSVMLSKMSTEEVVGWYGGAYRLFESFNFPYILTMALYPVLSRLWKAEMSSHRRAMQKSLEIVVLAGIPVMVGGIVLARPIIGFFYGLKAFEPSVLLLQILMAGILFLYVDMVLGTTLLSVDRQKHLMFVSLAAIPVNIGLNLLLIPTFESSLHNGAIGAAAATGITEVGIMLAVLNILPREMLAGFRAGIVFKSLAAGAGMAAALVFLTAAGIPWIIAGLLALAAYGGFLILLRVFEPEEREFLRGLASWKGMRALHAADPKGEVAAGD